MNCELIRDLLPLYLDNVCSPASQQAVCEHLEVCASCREELQGMQTDFTADTENLSGETAFRAASRALKKNKRRAFLIGWTAALTVVALLAGLYVGVHWFTTAKVDDTAALAKQTADYFNSFSSNIKEVQILDTAQRGDYLAVFFKRNDSRYGMCVFERDSVFDNRWKASGGLPQFDAEEIASWHYGSPKGEMVLIFVGGNLPKDTSSYTFQNSGITYICPIENEQVLDLFIIPDGNDIHGTPELNKSGE